MTSGAGPVLLIEDSEVAGYLLQQQLVRHGISARWIRDGRAAFAAIDQDAPARAVLMDIALPYADGFELLQHLRAHPRWSRVPVYVVSGKAKPADRTRALACGATAYYTKPVDPDELVARVRQGLEQGTGTA